MAAQGDRKRMIQHTEIENALGVQTLVSDAMQAALQNWFDSAIQGQPLDYDADVQPMGWPAMICATLAQKTTVEMEVRIDGSARAEWIGRKMRRVLSPRMLRKFSLALALGSAVWKPYQTPDSVSVDFVPACDFYPIAVNESDELTEAVFVEQIVTSDDVYTRLEWMHTLTGPQDYHDSERDKLEEWDMDPSPLYPCVQIINLAYRSGSTGSLGTPIDLDKRPEWEGLQRLAYITGADKLPVGYFVTPIANTVDMSSQLGEAMFEPARRAIIQADRQFTRLDWEYEGGELAIDTDQSYLKPQQPPRSMTEEYARKHYGVPKSALTSTLPQHKDRVFRGIDVNTGITQTAPFYQVFAPQLRDGSYLSGLNDYVRRVEMAAGLSVGTFSQVGQMEKTATEIMASKQSLYSTVKDLQAALESALRGLIAALDFWAGHVKEAPPRGAVDIAFLWDDSILIDALTERAQWQTDVQMGLRSRVEYRQHFFGEDEATAEAALAKIQSEGMPGMDILQGVLSNGQNQQQNQNSSNRNTGGSAAGRSQSAGHRADTGGSRANRRTSR